MYLHAIRNIYSQAIIFTYIITIIDYRNWYDTNNMQLAFDCKTYTKIRY